MYWSKCELKGQIRVKIEIKKVFEAKLRDSPLDEEWCERLNEANDKVREAIECRDKLQVDHKRVTKIFQKSDRIMASYLLNQKSRIEKCQSYFELRKVIHFFLCSEVVWGCQFVSLIPSGNDFWRIRLWNVTIRSIIILIVSWRFYSANWVYDPPRDHGQKVQGDVLWLLLG